MDSVTLSRRSLLQAIAATIATAAMPSGWAEIAQAAQPTMTIQALAFRAGEHIAEFARRGEI